MQILNTWNENWNRPWFRSSSKSREGAWISTSRTRQELSYKTMKFHSMSWLMIENCRKEVTVLCIVVAGSTQWLQSRKLREKLLSRTSLKNLRMNVPWWKSFVIQTLYFSWAPAPKVRTFALCWSIVHADLFGNFYMIWISKWPGIIARSLL